jgi:hypothetical protein
VDGRLESAVKDRPAEGLVILTPVDEVRMNDSRYERDITVPPAEVESFAALRRRVLRGDQEQLEASALPDLYLSTTRRRPKPALSPLLPPLPGPGPGGQV